MKPVSMFDLFSHRLLLFDLLGRHSRVDYRVGQQLHGPLEVVAKDILSPQQ